MGIGVLGVGAPFGSKAMLHFDAVLRAVGPAAKSFVPQDGALLQKLVDGSADKLCPRAVELLGKPIQTFYLAGC